MYADKITDSMRQTIDETERRRSIQLAYNEAHGITPKAIVKARTSIVGLEAEVIDDSTSDTMRRPKQLNARDKRDNTRKSVPKPYIEPENTSVDIAADPVVAYMNADELQRSINRLRGEMLQAAKDMEFITAARLRDEIIKLEARLENMDK